MSSPASYDHDAARREAEENAARDLRPEPVEFPAVDEERPDPIDEAAYHGLAGDLVRAFEPHTEAAPEAILVQFLAGFGSMIHRSAYWTADGSKHHSNLFVGLVGPTARGRKGTSWSRVRGVLEAVDEEWTNDKVVSGLSSGEGLIYHCRDESFVPKPGKDGQKATLVSADPGVSDKRLLVQESELASVLRVCDRQSSTLSTTIRQAWDSGNLRTLTRNSPLRSTDAHISIVGHITLEELRSGLSSTDRFNGFSNRFLWVWAQRSKLLPGGGGEPDRLVLNDLTRRVAEAAVRGRKGGEYRRDEGAREYWGIDDARPGIYHQLNQDVPGALGACTARGDANTMRLAMLYAILDADNDANEIRLEHLEAAYALWKYSFASARLIFGERSGDTTSDRILEFIREAGPDGVSRSEIRDLFKRHKAKAEIDRALDRLRARNLIRSEKTDTGGRPTERWSVATSAT